MQNLGNMQAIYIRTINQGGIADSPYMGAKNSVAYMKGFDIHSSPGILKVNQKFTKDSGNTIDDLVRAIVPSTDGNIYFFGSTSGKIWKRDSNGNYSLVATATPSAGSAGILSAVEYEGYIYYAMQNKLGRWQIGTAWSSRNDNFATFTNGNASYHPMQIVNDTLYIGDGNLVAQVDDTHTFVANALDLQKKYIISALGKFSTDLLIGTVVSDVVNKAEVFRWNTWSVSFSSSDPINENGILSFIEGENFVFVMAGLSGNLYYYNGQELVLFKQIPGNYSPTNTVKMYSDAWANFKGIPIFGISNKQGNPAPQGIYSLGSKNEAYPKVLNVENYISTENNQNIEIGAIAVVGNDIYVSWKDSNGAVSYGVDKLDYSQKTNAELETRVMKLDGIYVNTFTKFIVNYKKLPSGTEIKLYYRTSLDDTYTLLPTVVDMKRMQVFVERQIQSAKLQLKVETISSGNAAPEIEDIVVLVE